MARAETLYESALVFTSRQHSVIARHANNMSGTSKWSFHMMVLALRSLNYSPNIIKTSGLARAVLQTPSLLIIHKLTESVNNPVGKYLQKTVSPKP